MLSCPTSTVPSPPPPPALYYVKYRKNDTIYIQKRFYVNPPHPLLFLPLPLAPSELGTPVIFYNRTIETFHNQYFKNLILPKYSKEEVEVYVLQLSNTDIVGYVCIYIYI